MLCYKKGIWKLAQQHCTMFLLLILKSLWSSILRIKREFGYWRGKRNRVWLFFDTYLCCLYQQTFNDILKLIHSKPWIKKAFCLSFTFRLQNHELINDFGHPLLLIKECSQNAWCDIMWCNDQRGYTHFSQKKQHNLVSAFMLQIYLDLCNTKLNIWPPVHNSQTSCAVAGSWKNRGRKGISSELDATERGWQGGSWLQSVS